jgi:hypothetical protein
MASAVTRYVHHSFRTSLAYLYASIFRSSGAGIYVSNLVLRSSHWVQRVIGNVSTR